MTITSQNIIIYKVNKSILDPRYFDIYNRKYEYI